MFTGIIEGLGTVAAVSRGGAGVRMALRSEYALDDLGLGDSVAVNGACLTVVSFKDRTFYVDVSPETLSKTTMGQIRVGDRVNLERALRLGDRLDGHMVSGHIDGMGKVAARRSTGNVVIFVFEASSALCRYIVEKGSVAVDGISLTVNGCTGQTFEVSVIPHTAEVTTLGLKRVGDPVNIETDIIGKYVERFTRQARGGWQEGAIDEGTLAEAGFF
jgi:riboflavin synthase